ncbi:hypothetical protein ABTK00_22785, partial [Acinetobacter baumannii]
DYADAARLQTKLNAAADAAALAAVSQPMMKQNATTAQNTAIASFNAQAANIPGLTYNSSNLTVTVTDTGVTSITRV